MVPRVSQQAVHHQALEMLGTAQHHKRENQFLNRVLTKRPAKDGHVRLLKSRSKSVPWEKKGALDEEPAYLPANQAKGFKSRCMRNLFIALDP